MSLEKSRKQHLLMIARQGETLELLCMRVFGDLDWLSRIIDLNRNLLMQTGLVLGGGERIVLPDADEKKEVKKVVEYGGVF